MIVPRLMSSEYSTPRDSSSSSPLLKFFRLLCQLCRTGVELARLFIDLRLAALQTRLAVGQRMPHLGELSLPFDELLAEGGDGQAVLGPGPLDGGPLAPQPLGLGLDLGSQPFQVVLTLAGVGV